MQVMTGSGTSTGTVCPAVSARSVPPMRVVGGSLSGRRLMAPTPGKGPEVTRPTTDKVREALFNALTSRDAVADRAVLDLFAGSGALGIEALSRGARQCTFVERDRRAVDALRKNLHHLDLTDRATVVMGDVMSQLERLGPVDLVLADPPYAFDRWDDLLAGIDAPLVVAESDHEVSAPTGWSVGRSRRYGRTWVTWLERVP